ncbi:hypothetical protein SAMN05444282_1491, partial [Bacteroides ovatus]
IRKLWVITKPGLEKVWALRIKKGCVSVLTQPLHYFIIMFYREELIACAMDLNSSSDNFSFGFENNISDSF